jgi:hypothetical protein
MGNVGVSNIPIPLADPMPQVEESVGAVQRLVSRGTSLIGVVDKTADRLVQLYVHILE